MSESLIPLPMYLKEVEEAEKMAFFELLDYYTADNINVLDLCSGVGRTKRWIEELRPKAKILCTEIDPQCLENLSFMNNALSMRLDINENWDALDEAGHYAFDLITCFGGLNHYVNWNILMKNLYNYSNAHILHFNRNDTKEGLQAHQAHL